MNFTNQLSVEEFHRWIIEKRPFQLIDMSDDNLLKDFHVRSKWIPTNQILNRLTEIPGDFQVVLCCRIGETSFFLMNQLLVLLNRDNIYSLKSGIDGYMEFLKMQ